MSQEVAQQERVASLSKLRIERSQRPTGSRGWLLLTGLVVVVAALAAAAGWWYYSTTGVSMLEAMTERPVEVTLVHLPDAAPQKQPAAVVLVANGRIVSDRQVNVATKVSGQIVELNVEQGDHVEEGQVLARIEDVVYRALRDEAAATVERKRVEIERAKAEVARTQAAVQQAQAEAEFRRRDYERTEKLYKSGQASEFEYLNDKNLAEASAAAVKVAQAAAAAAEVNVRLVQVEVGALEAGLRVDQKRLDDCAIRAPISGVILERNAQVGDFLAAEGGRGANANAQLVSIADTTLMRVEIDVSERDVGRLAAEQPARVTPDAARSRAYEGFVMWIDPQGDYARAIVQVKVRIRDPGPDLRVGGSAKVEFLSGEPATPRATDPPTFWIPKSAVKLTSGSNEALVFTVDKDSRARGVAIQVGARTDKLVEVTRGASPGMTIVAENADALADGKPLRVMRTVELQDL